MCASDTPTLYLEVQPATPACRTAYAQLPAGTVAVSREEWERLNNRDWPNDLRTCGEISCDECNARFLALREENEQLKAYVGNEMYRSDFRTAAEMRANYEHVVAENQKLREENQAWREGRASLVKDDGREVLLIRPKQELIT